MELNLGNVLIVPSGTPGLDDKRIEMGDIYKLEARQQEIAIVNKVTAPELMQAFIDGYGHASRAQIQLEWELTQALKHADERRAVVYLDIAPKTLQEKGLTRPNAPAGSEDQRKAVLALDKDYQSLQDRVSMIEAAVEFLKTKTKAFEMSYQSVKKVYDSLSTVNALANAQPRGAFSAGSYNDGPEPVPATFKVGNPRY
jgi:hypothetical protein